MYQETLAKVVQAKQKAALRFAGFFAPSSKLALFLRNRIMNLVAVPWIADLAFARDFRGNLILPE
jgi:hypothetical protein